MERYVTGDASAFRLLYQALAPCLRAYLLGVIADRCLIEDLLQQTFLRLHETRWRFARGSPVAPWAFTIAHRLLIDDLRRAKLEASYLAERSADEIEASSAAPSADEVLQLKRLETRCGVEIGHLPVSQRDAFQLVRRGGMTVTEASRTLGVSVTAVKIRLHRAGRTLRRTLGLRAAGRTHRGAKHGLEATLGEA